MKHYSPRDIAAAARDIADHLDEYPTLAQDVKIRLGFNELTVLVLPARFQVWRRSAEKVDVPRIRRDSEGCLHAHAAVALGTSAFELLAISEPNAHLDTFRLLVGIDTHHLPVREAV